MSSAEGPLVPQIGEGKRGESGYIGYLLRQASAASRLATDRALEDLGVTQPQFMAMTMINAYPGCSGADLARLSLVTPQTMSLIISNLEREGRVQRAMPEQGRAQRLELTPAGLDLLNQCKGRMAEMDRSLRNGLSAEEEAIIRRWLVDVAVRELG
jgi:DNA-binding MarR family transcriptional regulator